MCVCVYNLRIAHAFDLALLVSVGLWVCKMESLGAALTVIRKQESGVRS